MRYITIVSNNYKLLENIINIILSLGINVGISEFELEKPKTPMILNSKQYSKRIPISQTKPSLRTESCISCGACVYTCPRRAILWTPPKKPWIVKEICEGCNACYYVCPRNAILLENRVLGYITLYHYKNIDVYIPPPLECCEHTLVNDIAGHMKRGILYFNKNYVRAIVKSIDLSDMLVIFKQNEIFTSFGYYKQIAKRLGKDVVEISMRSINWENWKNEIKEILTFF